MKFLCLQDLDVKNKKALVRVDFNVPFDSQGSISDLTRIQESIPTIKFLLQQKASVILLSHLGRPKGRDLKCTLKPCGEALSKLLELPVFFSKDCLGETAKKQAHELKPGQVLLLENLRFYEAEENPTSDPSFAKNLASYGDFYVNDAFGAAHRNHSSIVTITHYFPEKAAAGLLLQKEIAALTPLIKNPVRPFHIIIGGAKMSSKLKVLETFVEKADAIYIGGAMAFTFLKSLGLSIGDSLYEQDLLLKAKEIILRCENLRKKIHLPLDIIASKGKEIKTVLVSDEIEPGWKGLDVGSLTINAWKKPLTEAKSIFWNGPLGRVEEKEFAQGTFCLAEFLASLPSERVIGGGDSIAVIQKLGLKNKFTHLSTGGGASLEFFELGTLPGIEALSHK